MLDVFDMIDQKTDFDSASAGPRLQAKPEDEFRISPQPGPRTSLDIQRLHPTMGTQPVVITLNPKAELVTLDHTYLTQTITPHTEPRPTNAAIAAAPRPPMSSFAALVQPPPPRPVRSGRPHRGTWSCRG
jgi:hypothetical protein